MWSVLLEDIDSAMGHLHEGAVISHEAYIDLLYAVKNEGVKLRAFPSKEDALEWQGFYYPNENQIVE